MRKLILFFILISCLTSCELVREIDSNPYFDGGKIIVHGFISKNDGIQVQVNKTVPVNYTKISDYLPNAQIILFADNVPQFNLIQADRGFFVSPENTHLVEGVAYKIKVISQDYGEAESGIQYILPEISIDSLVYKKDTITWKGEKLLYYLKDPDKTSNYYSFYYTAFHQNSIISSSKPTNDFILSVFSDALFNGEKNWNEISFRSSFYKYDTIRIIGRLYNISSEFSRFLESLKEYEYTKEDPFFDYTSPVFTNIKNGYGIFGSYSFSEKEITYIKPK